MSAPIPAPIAPRIPAAGKITSPPVGLTQKPLHGGVKATTNAPTAAPEIRPTKAPLRARDVTCSILATDDSGTSMGVPDRTINRSDCSDRVISLPFVTTPVWSVIVSRAPPCSEPWKSRNELATCAPATVATPSTATATQPAILATLTGFIRTLSTRRRLTRSGTPRLLAGPSSSNSQSGYRRASVEMKNHPAGDQP